MLQHFNTFLPWRRPVAGALVLVLGRLGLPYAATLFMHASLGAALTAQYAAITTSRWAAQQRQAARAARAGEAALLGALEEAAAEADSCARLLTALRAETFSNSIWEAAAAGQSIDLALLEV